MGNGRRTRNARPFRQTSGHPGLGANHRIAADFDVTHHSGLPGEDHTVSQPTGTGNAGLGNNDTILSDADIMGDLDKIVDFRPSSDHRFPKSCPVYSAIRADFHVVSDRYSTDLRDLMTMALIVRRITKTVRTDNGIGLNDHPVPDVAILSDNHTRMKETALSDHHPGTDINPGANNCSCTYPATFPNDSRRPHFHRAFKEDIFGNAGLGVNTLTRRGQRIKNLHDPCEGKIWIGDDDLRFDLPSVGMKTLELMAEVGGRVLALEAGKSLILDTGHFLETADRYGICVMGVSWD